MQNILSEFDEEEAGVEREYFTSILVIIILTSTTYITLHLVDIIKRNLFKSK